MRNQNARSPDKNPDQRNKQNRARPLDLAAQYKRERSRTEQRKQDRAEHHAELLAGLANQRKLADSAPPVESDWIWGAPAIGVEINRTPEQIYYLFSTGVFRDAVWKMGLKTMVASRQKLRELAEQLASENS